MSRPPDQAPEPTDGATHLGALRATSPDPARRRRDHRRRGEPPRAAVERRWRFADAVAAARQLGSSGASAT